MGSTCLPQYALLRRAGGDTALKFYIYIYIFLICSLFKLLFSFDAKGIREQFKYIFFTPATISVVFFARSFITSGSGNKWEAQAKGALSKKGEHQRRGASPKVQSGPSSLPIIASQHLLPPPPRSSRPSRFRAKPRHPRAVLSGRTTETGCH